MEQDEVLKREHPSIAQRKKLDQKRKERLARALRDNLKKRKDQVKQRGAKEDQSIPHSVIPEFRKV
jgi:hypothetical protein